MVAGNLSSLLKQGMPYYQRGLPTLYSVGSSVEFEHASCAVSIKMMDDDDDDYD